MTVDPNIVGLASDRLMELGFAAALLATLWKKYWGYAVFMALALAEAHENMRFPFHVWVRDLLMDIPQQIAWKGALQSTLMYVTGMLGLAVIVLLFPFFLCAPKGRRIMIVGGLAIAAMLALELISPHYVDSMIYHPVGPFTRSAIGYFVAAVAIVGGALMKPRTHEHARPLDA